MRQIIRKIKILKMLLLDAFDTWKKEVWEKDLDGPYCCSGTSIVSPCGCGGMTVGESFGETT